MIKLIRTIEEASLYGAKLGDMIDVPEPVRKVNKKYKESEK